MRKMIYISGKIGQDTITPEIREKFRKAEEMLVEYGWVVFSPATEKYQKKLKKEVKIEEKKWKDCEYGEFDWYSWALLYDMHLLALANAIYMLKDWRSSPGARAEHAFAKACKKDIIYE